MDDYGYAGCKPQIMGQCEVCDQGTKFYLNPSGNGPRWFCYEHFMTIDGSSEWFDLKILVMRGEYGTAVP